MDRRDFMLGAAAIGGASALMGQAAVASPAVPAAAATASTTAMQALLRNIGELQAQYLSPAYGITSAADIAEGQRLVLHLLNTALNFWLEADPEHPVWTSYTQPSRKLLGDNPDALYYFAAVRGDRSYRIRGNLAGATFTSFTVEGGSGAGNAAGKSTAALDDMDMQVDQDGNYEIIASTTRPASGNWLPLAGDSGQITTRHYYETRNNIVNQTAFQVPLRIEAIDALPLAPAPGDAEIARRIDTVSRFVGAMLAMTVASSAAGNAAPSWFSKVPNSFNAPGKWVSETGYGNLHAHYAAAPFVLMPDEALLIEGELPQCRFANLVLWNRYMQTFDYTRRQVSLNRAQMAFDANGHYTLVLAHRDPGLPNWLDTEGRVSGIMYWRFLLASGTVPTPRARVVKFAEIAKA
ncbi:MAG: DUF1214 domain-containing protein [Gammaproteobacteria bacterium]|nr:DUF1214 domain-containing protein [Gammaproteobacteria bacterium]MBK8991043.1 DUF1214 domain-containing protein [Gammaproteobacteria bacterium]MBK9467488.1 DUF1214 domain-containing protein [Gammaproteobacteria bacterium]MBP7911197.1 DUF1214 domain-containing protein [Pseudomonadales bacterium]